jgi:hypothetical protein
MSSAAIERRGALRRAPVVRPAKRSLPEIRPKGARCRRATTFSFRDVPRERWEAIFGPESERVERFRAALARQKAAGGERTPGPAPAVHGDRKGAGRRLYRGFDFGLGRMIEGRADRRRAMEELHLQEV